MDTKKIKGQFMNRSTFWMIKYMNGSVFSKAKYMNGVGFEILARTPVPKLPLSYRPPLPHPPLPPRTPPQELKSRHSERCEAVFFKNFSVTIYRPSFFFFLGVVGWCEGAVYLTSPGRQLILAYSWARPAILVVGKGRGGMFLFLLFLYFHSCSSFFPAPLFHLLYSLFSPTLSSISFLPFSGRRHKMTLKG